jgi:UDP:flavonoid glycosyltransferase YjiC (YdhE family)
MDNLKAVNHHKAVLILIGPGFGHYHPIANLSLAIRNHGYPIIVIANVTSDSALANRIREDGYQFHSLAELVHGNRWSRAAHRILLKLLDQLSAWTARIPSSDELPHLLARLIFGVRSYIKPLSGVNPQRIRKLTQLFCDFNPALVLADAVAADGINYLCATHCIPWIEYTTSPANVLAKDHPIYPAGLSPQLKKGERMVNHILWWMNRSRSAHQRRKLLLLFPASLEAEPNFSPRYKACFSTQEIDDYVLSSQNEFRYVGVSLYKLPTDLPEIDLPDGGIYVSFGSTGTKRDLALLQWLIQELIVYELPIYMQVIKPEICTEIKNRIPVQHLSKIHFIGRLPRPAYEIYNKARLVISHGGYNTVIESLYFGCPVLLIPNIVADRMEVARRVVENGYGHCINYYSLNSVKFHIVLEDLLFLPNINGITKYLATRLRNNELYQAFLRDIMIILEESNADNQR